MNAPQIPLGVPLMDEDHARLEALFETASSLPDAELGAFLARVRDELAQHFAREEELMRQHDAPVLHCHIAQHHMLLTEVDMAGTRAAGDVSAQRRLLTRDLPALVLSHVASVDQVTSRFLGGNLDIDAVAALRLPVENAS